MNYGYAAVLAVFAALLFWLARRWRRRIIRERLRQALLETNIREQDAVFRKIMDHYSN